MNIVHFITDDKFLNGAIQLFNDIEFLNNRYFIITDNSKFTYLSTQYVEIIPKYQVREFIRDPYSCDVLIIHGLSALPCCYIKDIHPYIKVVWFSWGYDIYSNRYPQFKLIKLENRIKPHTLDFNNKLQKYRTDVKFALKKLLRVNEKDTHDFVSAIHRIDYYSGVYPIEYDFLKEHAFFRAKPIQFNYCSSKTAFLKSNTKKDIFPCGKNILVGNSGAILGNQRNTLFLLRKFKLNDRKVILPLSYGGTPAYTNSVIRMGKKFYGDRFMPILDFIPLEQYNKLLLSVSIAIHNLEQQAAVGNIILNIWNGAKVFMPKTSINFKYLSNLGLKIYSIENDLTQNEIDNNMKEEDIIKNRMIISNTFSYESIKQRVINSLKLVEYNLDCRL